MAQYFKIHPDNPQVRLLNQASLILEQGGVIVYPTDSCLALGCLPGNKSAFERILSIRRLNHKHNFTLLCSSMATVGALAKTDNTAFRLIKRLTPGPYTFLLRASHQDDWTEDPGTWNAAGVAGTGRATVIEHQSDIARRGFTRDGP